MSAASQDASAGLSSAARQAKPPTEEQRTKGWTQDWTAAWVRLTNDLSATDFSA